MCVQWLTQLILVRYWSLWCPSACFQRIQDIDLDSRNLLHESKIPFPTMFITSSLLLLILKLKEYQDDLVTGKMFHSSKQNVYQGPFKFTAPFRVDIQLMKMCKRKRCKITVKLSGRGCYTNLYGNDSLFFLPFL